MKHNIIVPLLVASIAGGVAGASINTEQQVAQAKYTQQTDITNVVGSTVEISNFNSSANIGQEYELPTYVVKDEQGNIVNESLKVVVKEPSGRRLSSHTDMVLDEEDNLVPIANPEVKADGTFIPNVRGYYEISFEAEEEGQLRTITESLRVFVHGEDYTIELPQNSKYVVPSIIPTSTTNALKIPVPTMTHGEKDYNPFENENSGLEVYVLDINGQGGDTPLKIDGTKSFYEWMPTKSGVYEIVYKYVKGTVQDYKTQRFTVRDAKDYDTSKIVLNFSYASSRPTTAVLGVETELPKINVVDRASGNAIEAYTDITVRHIETNKNMDVQDFKFTPTERGSYVVTYTAKLDYFSDVSDQKHSFIIDNVRDSQAPVVRPTNPFELNEAKDQIIKVLSFEDNSVLYEYDENESEEKNNEEIEKALGSLEYAVPSVAVKGTEVRFPAMFATDNVSTYGKITYTRSIRQSSDNQLSQIKSDSFNEVGTYTFEKEGDYTVRYIVKDESGNERQKTFTVKVVDSLSELQEDNNLVKPKVELKIVQVDVRSDAKINFSIPTPTDKHDSRVQVKAFYQLTQDPNGTKYPISPINNDNQYELDLSKLEQDLTDVERIYIIAEAYNDYNPTPTIVRQSVGVINRSDDKIAPVFEISSFLENLVDVNEKLVDENDQPIVISEEGYYLNANGLKLEPFSQKDEITLPAVRVTDNLDKRLGFTVEVRNPEGRVVNIADANSRLVDGATNTYEISGGKFIANDSGIYTITYTAKDAGGNMAVRSYGIRVRDTEKPTIGLNSYDAFSDVVQVGEFVEIPRATITDNGRVLEDHEIAIGEKYQIDPDTGERTTDNTGVYKPGYRWELIRGNHLIEHKTGRGFAPGVAGEYVVVYEAWDANGNTAESRAYTIVAKDTLKPTIELEKDLILPSKVEFNDGEYVVLPGIANYYDGRQEGKETDFEQTPKSDILIEFKITDSNGVEVKDWEQFNDETGGGIVFSRYRFIPTKQSVYNIKYIATDNVGNRTEITKTLEVGDVYAPTLEFAEDYEFKTTANVGDYYTFKLEDLVIKDDVDKSEDIRKQVYLYNPDRRTVQNAIDTEGEYSWKLEEVGTYELRVILTDSANNSETFNYNIAVSEDDAKTSVISENAGTVLIAVTAVILAGVVVYFIVSGRGGKGKGSKGSSRQENKDNTKK